MEALWAVLPVLVLLSIVSAYFLYPGLFIETKAPAAARNIPAAATPAPIDFNSQALEEYRSGRFEKAEPLFTKALEAGPVSAAVYSNKGLAFMRVGKKNDAETAFKKALDIDPLHPQALNNYACLLAEAGKTAKARAMLEKAVKADPSYADAYFNMAVLLEKKGDLTGALESYEEFIRLEPVEGGAPQVRKKLMELRSEIIVKQAGRR
jgi:Flp pilus assembly protein TadD